MLTVPEPGVGPPQRGQCEHDNQQGGHIVICFWNRIGYLFIMGLVVLAFVTSSRGGNLLASGDINGTLRVLTCTGEVRAWRG